MHRQAGKLVVITSPLMVVRVGTSMDSHVTLVVFKPPSVFFPARGSTVIVPKGGTRAELEVSVGWEFVEAAEALLDVFSEPVVGTDEIVWDGRVLDAMGEAGGAVVLTGAGVVVPEPITDDGETEGLDRIDDFGTLRGTEVLADWNPPELRVDMVDLEGAEVLEER